MKPNPHIIAVIGGRECSPGQYQEAMQVGKGIAERGDVLICGGKGGIMEGACRGAAENDGLTIGILTGSDTSEANPWVRIALPSGIGIARNYLIAQSCQAAVAIGGRYGTLSEIAYCLQLQKPVFAIGSWEIPGAQVVDSAAEALERLYRELGT